MERRRVGGVKIRCTPKQYCVMGVGVARLWIWSRCSRSSWEVWVGRMRTFYGSMSGSRRPMFSWKSTELWYWRALPTPMETSVVLSTNRKFTNNGTKTAKFRETVNNAIELNCNIDFDGIQTPRACLLRAVSILLSYAPDRDWDLEEEMKRWCVGESPLLPPHVAGGNALADASDQRLCLKLWCHTWLWLKLMHFVCLTTHCTSINPSFCVTCVESVQSWNLERSRSSGLAADTREALRKEAQKGCFGNLLQKMYLPNLLI